MDDHIIERLFRGVAAGCVITAGIAVILYIALPTSLANTIGIIGKLGIPPLIAALILYPHPILLKTLWRERRAATLLDEDVNAGMLGIAVGLASGVWIIARFVPQIL
jgi:hypothetical protein